MIHVNKLNDIPDNKRLVVGIDITGNIKALFHTPQQVRGGLFLLCLRGACTIKIHLNTFEMKKDNIVVVLPDQFVQLLHSDENCRFAFVGCSRKVSENPELFSKVVQYAPFIYERPMLELSPYMAGIFFDYFKVLMKMRKISDYIPEEQSDLICAQLLMSIGTLAQHNIPAERPKINRNEEIVKDLIRMIVENYKTERRTSFYIERMHISHQHLCATLKHTTGRTLTDIISSFVIRDAQAKLQSTDMTVQEIAYSLNFQNVSFFGKYFKRHVGMSPKQYRNR